MKESKQNAVKQQIFNFRESISQILRCDIYKNETRHSRSLLNSHSVAQVGGTLTAGFSELDKLSVNLQPSNLMIIASFPWMNASELLLSMATNITLNQKKRIGIINRSNVTEMIAARILSNIVDISPFAMREGWLTSDDANKIICAKSILDYESIIIATESIDGNALLKCIRNMKMQHDIEYVFIDAGKKKWRDVTESYAKQCMKMMVSIKKTADELQIPIIVSIDLPAKYEECGNVRPSLKDVEKYGCIENVADIMALVYLDESWRFENKDRMGKETIDGYAEITESEIIIAKNGDKSEEIAYLTFNRDYARFESRRI